MELSTLPRGTSAWRGATVVGVERPGPRVVVLRLAVTDRVVQLPGQHYVVRLTAPDGYTATRSYSVASAPGDELVELFVERLEDGEVSTYLADVVCRHMGFPHLVRELDTKSEEVLPLAM